jgi:hypothetical protein
VRSDDRTRSMTLFQERENDFMGKKNVPAAFLPEGMQPIIYGAKDGELRRTKRTADSSLRKKSIVERTDI